MMLYGQDAMEALKTFQCTYLWLKKSFYFMLFWWVHLRSVPRNLVTGPETKLLFWLFWEATLGSNNCGDIGHEFFNLDLNCSSFVNRLCAYVCLPSGTPTFRADAPFLSQQEHLQRTHFVTPPFSLL